MRRTPAGTATAILAAFIFAAPLHAAPTTATGAPLSATLTGAAETPPGDADGTGMFSGKVDVGQGKLCYTLTSAKLDTLTMAHIHAGAVGVSGPPVVTLAASSPTETCMDVDKDIAQKLVASPGDYYVNIHTTDHPGGAIRGQLTKP